MWNGLRNIGLTISRMKIEKIERSKHKQERVLVYLEGGDLLQITESELLRFGLCIGLDIDDRTVVELQQSGARSETRVRAANMISSRPLSRKELAKKLREKGGICGVHCENSGVIDALIAEKKAAGEMGVGSHPRTRPDFLEAEAVSRLLRIAQAVDIPVVIVHLTNAAALREVEAARKRGQRVYVETCPQYLLLDDSVYDDPDYTRAARYVCAPPIRKTEDQRVLWAALRKGEIQTVSTDHCSFTLEQKDAGRGDFTRIPGGLPGVETRGELLYTYGVTTRKISLATMCRVLSENPAKLYGMFPRKGVLQAGADADIVVYDPQADHLLRAEDMTSLAGYTPYEGFPIRGGIRQVWLRGRLAVEDGFVLAGPDGKYISRGKCSL